MGVSPAGPEVNGPPCQEEEEGGAAAGGLPLLSLCTDDEAPLRRRRQPRQLPPQQGCGSPSARGPPSRAPGKSTGVSILCVCRWQGLPDCGVSFWLRNGAKQCLPCALCARGVGQK